ncbi:MAG: phosphatase PAP2 family protein [Candidatus Izemoplasmataceae bacterium]
MFNGNNDIIIALQKLESIFLDFFFNAISFLGEEFVYIAILSGLYWVYNKKMGEFIGVTLGISFSLNTFFKEIFSKPRPFETSSEIINKRPGTSTGHSMPSGHAQGAATFYLSTALAIKKHFIIVIAGIIITLMMISRMYLGVHYLEDVLVGAIIGIILSIGSYYLFYKKSLSDQTLHKIYLGIIILFLPVAVIYLNTDSANDFYKGYGIMIGIMSGVMIEKRWISFQINKPLNIKMIRYIIGVISLSFVLIITGFMKDLWIESTSLINLFDIFRYGFLGVLGFGLYPYIFTKLNF